MEAGAASLNITDPDDLPRSEGDVEAVRAMTIEALVAEGPASVRLCNTIERGVLEGNMPCTTVGEYLDAGPAARSMFMTTLWAFGKGTANELEALIAAYLERCAIRPGDCAVASGVRVDRDPRREALLTKLAGLTYGDALKGQVVSARLGNVLAGSPLANNALTDLLTGGQAVRAELLRKPNFGRKSLVELEGLVQAQVVRVLVRHCSDPAILLDDCAYLFGTPAGRRVALANLILETVSASPPRDVDLKGLLDWALPILDERETAILHRRYGFHTGVVETLEEISETYSVTRERVRQIEAKALRKLAAKLDGTALRKLLGETSEHFWEERRAPFLPVHDSHQIRRELPPHLSLALDIAGLSLGEWLAQTSVAMRYGFLAKSCDTDAVLALGEELRQTSTPRKLPAAVDDLLPGVDPVVLLAAVCVETELWLADGYLFDQKPRARLRRMVRLHRLLCKAGRALSIYELGEAYALAFGDDACSLRDFDIVMEIAPHLFLEIEDGLWIAIGQGPRNLPLPQCEASERPYELIDPQTIAGALRGALIERGPTAVVDLYRDADRILEPGRSRNSVAPVIVSRPDLFLRVLPGVYALPEHALDEEALLVGSHTYLLNEAQVRAYVFGRKASEPWGTYRLWTPAAEYRMCGWARFEASPALYHSLLSVASIEAWPGAQSVRDEWQRIKALEGRFEIAVTGKAPYPEARPDLDRLLAACRITQERGALSWLSVNRMMGRRLDAAGGQGLLALMIALGCVVVPEADLDEQFLLAHPATERAAALAAQLEAERLRTGTLAWESVLGEDITREALAAAPDALGWVSLDRVAALLGAASVELAVEAPEDDDEEDDDLFARLMREHRRSAEVARRDAAAAWLLEDD